MMGAFGITLSVIFFFVWLIPITYVGSTKSDMKWLPALLRHQQRIACLFTNQVRAWSTYHIQVQTDGSDDWVEIEEEPFFVMDIFGYRSRFQRMMAKDYRKPRGLQRTREKAKWIHKHWPAAYPDKKLDAVRYVRIAHKVEVLAKETGSFRKRPLPPFSKRWQIFGEVRWDGKRAKHPRHPPRYRKNSKRRRKPLNLKKPLIKRPTTKPAIRTPGAKTPAPPAVEKAPPAVEKTPPAVEKTPPAVEKAPPAVEKAPPAVEKAPPAVEKAPPKTPGGEKTKPKSPDSTGKGGVQ